MRKNQNERQISQERRGGGVKWYLHFSGLLLLRIRETGEVPSSREDGLAAGILSLDESSANHHHQ